MRLLKLSPPLPANEPEPVYRYERNGKPLHAYFKLQWLEEYPWLIWSHSKQREGIAYCLPSYQEASHMVEGY